jgi:maleylpyruvate isomerase
MTGTVQARIEQVADATSRLLGALDGLEPERMGQPSLLPDWTVGHVLTHIARNADAQRNLLHWAATGEPTPMYPSPEARNADIQAGAGREPTEILQDVRISAERLGTAIRDLPEPAWSAQIDTGRGGPVAAEVVLSQRLAEVELHHHDLGVDGGLTLLSASDGHALLAAVLHSYVRARGVAGLVLVPDGGDPIRLGGPDPGSPGMEPSVEATIVRGRPVDLAGWLAGRTDGADLACNGPLPELPAW